MLTFAPDFWDNKDPEMKSPHKRVPDSINQNRIA